MDIVGSTAAEIFDSIRTLTHKRALTPGQALPTVRDLAGRLGVNRNTVSMAYKRLVTAGVAVTQGRLGTVIRDHAEPGEQEGVVPGSPLTDLGSGNPNVDWLPDVYRALAHRPYRPRLYGEPTVDPELDAVARSWLAGDCPKHFEMDLTNGAVDAVERLLSAYLVAGDKVAVEDPCFVSSANTLRAAGLQAVGVPVDSQGMQAGALEEALAQGAQAVIVTPRAHNPTGCCLSRARARALRTALTRYPHVLVIVDDHFSLLAESDYHDVIPPSAHRWALIRSMSKMLGPDMRMAFVASDIQTSRRLRLRLASGTNWVSHLLQDIVLACMTLPEAGARIGQIRENYALCREIVAAALSEQGLTVWPRADGLNLWLPLSESSQAIVLALARHGWLVRGGESFGVQTPVHGLRITVSNINEASAQAFAHVLGHVLRQG
ncbi:TPA: transcriptional regulator PtsJ [Stenotrophomonas maltophilia]|jgi:DNA-binding transcriptional MocR family regulator|uniref:MocR-like B6 salvage transcription factor PtsJ n=1 Tax=Burkholderia sp. LMG 13014 TaxID=2709306 RepID=UPI001963F35C|nr:transcriptional regulator PtsJ [Burkholderia sp. LMG 13014]HDS1367965.1 transcriptional regulator PtsJ [Stenotrophomonas maltophilia]HEJ3239984.1 transcriptional regulator PtsJ [Pseudomonas aeruginosa]HDS1372579.1 transcriptional regulator PtsJ [Stenotrophomonas maltophilia]HDS1376504.1 transcriptional regulator PtsJ [Stenotrophomonas maltophilia]HDS1381358.1 transcriptional regulator PtsJ [Stenotrophomonas maltophilia]